MASFPVGAVLAFAGPRDYPLDPESGWLRCDGSPYPANSGLVQVIGDIYGAGVVPDYAGYFLRGSSSALDCFPDSQPLPASFLALRDPDSQTRCSFPSGIAGPGVAPTVGTVQPPQLTAHSHGYQPITTGSYDDDGGWTCYIGQGSASSAPAGAATTVPVNMTVSFLVCGDDSATLPVGAVASYAGDSLPDDCGWLPCDGNPCASSGDYADLQSVLQGNYGYPDEDNFFVPDHRGVFLMADEGDTGDRTSPRPDQQDTEQQGTSQDVGSLQYSTVLAHSHSFPFWKQTYKIAKLVVPLHDVYTGHDDDPGTLEQSTPAQVGGAGLAVAEARPVNVGLTTIIFYGGDAASLYIPVGTVIAFAGPLNEAGTATELLAAGWDYCDGRLLDSTDYPALFAVLGWSFGGDGVTRFCLPDLRGVFVRGTLDARSTLGDLEPDAAGRQPSCTDPGLAMQGNDGDSIGSFQASNVGDHSHDYTLPAQAEKGNGNGDASENNFWMADSGGDLMFDPAGGSETRPKNAYVHYLIRTIV